jgi:hypothetical protein
MAQPSDPYGASDRKLSAEKWFALRDQAFANIKFIYFAMGCGAVGGGAEALLSPQILWLSDPRSGMRAVYSPQVVQQLEQGQKVAQRDGAAQAKEPGACDYFKQHPEVVRSLREMYSHL